MELFYTKFSEYEGIPECPLSTYRRNKILNTTNFDIKRKNIITEFFLLKCILTFDADINLPLNIQTTDNGKPFLPGFNKYFSISHSDDLLVICFDNNPIGVDCEKIGRKCDYRKIANRFFNENDKSLITDEDSFLEQWTKKEAYAKLMDISLYSSLLTDLSRIKAEHVIFEQYHISIAQ